MEAPEHHAHFLALARQFVEGHRIKPLTLPTHADRLAFQQHGSGIRHFEIVQAAQQCAFAGTGWADNAGHVPFSTVMSMPSSTR